MLLQAVLFFFALFAQPACVGLKGQYLFIDKFLGVLSINLITFSREKGMFLEKSITNFIDQRNSFFVSFRHNSTHHNTQAFVII